MTHSNNTDADVIVVGYGPVGQVLSTLLAIDGRRVIVAEQHAKPFPMPRAVAVDGYAARVLAVAGVADSLAEIGEPTPDYTVQSASGQTLMRFALDGIGRNGWPESTSMYQPGLEAALEARGRQLDSLTVMRGYRAVAVSTVEAGVAVGLEGDEESVELTAAWVVGCDGANSTVRGCIDPPIKDNGFAIDWMACDVVPSDPEAFPVQTLHIADPANPRVAVSAGPGHYRYEFLRLGGEEPAEFDSVSGAWRRLAAFGVTPANSTLERRAVYRIRSRCAEQWRADRLLIAGDAAHEMPPFAGQGLSSGIGDAANLAYKLGAVLDGAPDSVLDTYAAERLPRVRRSIDTSVRLGTAICTTDARGATARDAAMARTAGQAPPPVPDSIATGLLQRGPTGAPAQFAGRLLPQPAVGDGVGLDRLTGIGRGHVLLARGGAVESERIAGDLERLGVAFVEITPGNAFHAEWLDSLRGAVAALVRPDFYVFGVAHDADGIDALLGELARQLGAAAPVAG
jgi:flavoprotein hydroxylase